MDKELSLLGRVKMRVEVERGIFRNGSFLAGVELQLTPHFHVLQKNQ